MTRATARVAGSMAAFAMIALVAAMSVTGRWPVDSPRTHEEGHGILSFSPDEIARIDIRIDDRHRQLDRVPGGGWAIDGSQLDPAASAHIDTALRLLRNSAPRRVLASGEYDASQRTEYGLTTPRVAISLTTDRNDTIRISFGERTPAQNAQYVAIAGRAELYLLTRDIAEEWRLALDMTERTASHGADLLLPVSIARIWAVEIVTHGTLYRFERDPDGNWFHHVGQHVHAPGGLVHRADPARAPLIAAELAAIEQSRVDKVVVRHPDAAALAGAGLDHPPLIVLMYSRDTAGPVARIEFGAPAGTSLQSFARVQQTDVLVTVPNDAERHLGKLIEIAGTPS